ncbi:MAG TPA: hypothetical protein VF452_12605 [Candidatus Binatia bacterium]
MLLISAPADAGAEQNEESARWLTVWAGMLPIILAAPHGGRSAVPGIALRRGLGIPQFTTERDSNAAELAELVGAKLEALLGARPFLVVAHFERKFIDVNRAESNAFESASAKPYYDAYHRAIEEASSWVRRRWQGAFARHSRARRGSGDNFSRHQHWPKYRVIASALWCGGGNRTEEHFGSLGRLRLSHRADRRS